MDSSFLTFMSVALALFSLTMLLKMLVQFGLPNHPLRLISYVASLCVVVFFGWKALTALELVSPWPWMKWRSLPMVAGSLAVFLQVILGMVKLSPLQEKMFSRLPLLVGLVFMAIFPGYGDYFVVLMIAAGCLLILFSGTSARHQKRLYAKLAFFFFLSLILKWFNVYAAFIVGEMLMAFVLFYFFLFEQSFAIMALIEEKTASEEGLS